MKAHKKKLIKLGIVLRQNQRMLLIILLWFIVNFIILISTTLDLMKSLRLLVYIEEPDPGSAYQKFYMTYSDYVVFGLLIGLITVDALRDYNPSETSRILSSKLRGHVIITGYNHLGIHLHQYFTRSGVPHTIVDRYPGRLKKLFSEEEPAVVYDPLDDDFPRKIALERARLLVLGENDTVFNLQMVVLSRKINPDVDIIVRCFDDSIGKIFKSYNCNIISQSSATANRLLDRHADDGVKSILVIGFNHFAEKLSFMAAVREVHVTIMEHREVAVEGMMEFNSKLRGHPREYIDIFQGNPMDHRMLLDAGINTKDMVVITLEADDDMIILAKELKELNPRATIIARAFSDELEKILKDFGCLVVSTSTNAFETQIMPILEKVGLGLTRP
ncbi:MAG: NAD-binding protein [Promethearchaeota archaeon]